MSKSLPGTKIAILVSNGFNQQDMTDTQKLLNSMGASLKIISPDQGLVNGWEGAGWGHHFAVDQQLSTALGADFDVLMVPGGQRSLDKLKTTAHTRRFVNSFVTAGKPVALFNEAIDLLVYAEQVAGRTVSGPEAMKDAVVQAGAVWAEQSPVIDGALYTGSVSEEDRAVFIAGMLDFFIAHATVTQQQAA
ncbi:MAG: DJ-1/PfpI family protein [Micavibrio sp.]